MEREINFTNKKSENIYERLLYLAETFNIRGSSVYINLCYLSDTKYQDEDCENMIDGVIYGSICDSPYNTIQYHKKNEWLLEGLRTMYICNSNIIPHRFHNLPKIFKIQRSNGMTQDATVISDIYGIRIIQSSKRNDMRNHLYVRVHFSNQNKTLSIDDLAMYEYCGYNMVYKDIPLEHVIKLNPTIDKHNLKFTLRTLKVDESMPIEAEEVYNKINGELKNWCDSMLTPCLDYYKDRYDIHCSIVDNL